MHRGIGFITFANAGRAIYCSLFFFGLVGPFIVVYYAFLLINVSCCKCIGFIYHAYFPSIYLW
jgi:hypothetical protein